MAAERSPKAVAFTSLTSAATTPVLGLKYSQIAAEAPGKENCWQDPQDGKFCLRRRWLRDRLEDHREQQAQNELWALQQKGKPACA